MDKTKLLIVDDDLAILNQLKWALEDEYDVLVASKKEDALNIIYTDSPRLVALDVNLDNGDIENKSGMSILEEIKNSRPSTKVIMVTGNDSKSIALDAINKGVFDYYVKPVDVNELKVILRRALYIQRLEEENKHLYEELNKKITFENMVGNSTKMEEFFSLVRRVAPSEVTVLISGESGTGKELAAKALHRLSQRCDKPFIVINCGAIPENLLESELFGHERGAFTSAYTQKKGKLEIADKGTVFLDEIGEMSLNLQVKMLRFLQEKTIERVGDNIPIQLDVRIVAATNQDLGKRVERGLFRQDLYYRLSVLNLEIPPLRGRGKDIILLANYFFHKYKSEIPGKALRGFNHEAKDVMLNYTWPGNVREMENKIRRALIVAETSNISPSDLGFDEDKETEEGTKKLSLRETRQNAEENLIKKALLESKGNISAAAKILGISRPTLYDLMKKHQINIDR